MPAPSMTVSYSYLLERVGVYLYGIRSGFSTDRTNNIKDCIRDGLNNLYTAHNWSYFRPVVDLTTTAPYSTGTVTIVAGVVTLAGGTFPSWAADGMLKIGSNYYSVATRDSNTQLTLDDVTVAATAGTTYQLARMEVPLPDAFEAIANDSDLTYYPDQTELSPPVRQKHDQSIRKWQQHDPQFERPLYYSIRTTQFDPTVGSRKVLALYPIPNAAYVLRVPMVLRPVMLDTDNPYPIGGEQLGQLIVESCLASAEHNFEERDHVHTKRYMELLPLAIKRDQEHSSATSLGSDGSVSHSGVFSDSHTLREMRIGAIYFDGDTM